MRISDWFFYFVLSFLLGILLASLKINFLIVIGFVFLLILIFLILQKQKIIPQTKKWLFVPLFVIVAFFYYHLDLVIFQKNNFILFNQMLNFSGMVLNHPTIQNNFQEIEVKLMPPQRGKILVKLSRYPTVSYGDILDFNGVIKPLSSETKYLIKERINGVSLFPKFFIRKQNAGSFIKAALFKLNDKISQIFNQFLPSEEAGFLSGLTFGERANFSPSFKKALSLSGTTHLVALSGYNISIIILATMGLFSFFFSRRLSFFLTILLIIGFVLMTGASSSVVRAAIMGGLALLAKEIGRPHSIRNAIVFSAFLMVIFNPQILVFDIGFELSFLALLGIVYLKPAMIKFFSLSEKPGFLSWRENLLTTASAQLAVMPILISYFGLFSLTSLLANVIILEFIPLTMFLGFLMVGISFISFFSTLISWLVSIFLKLEIIIINVFSQLVIPLPLSKNTSFIFFLIYYLFLLAFIFYAQKIHQPILAEAQK